MEPVFNIEKVDAGSFSCFKISSFRIHWYILIITTRTINLLDVMNNFG